MQRPDILFLSQYFPPEMGAPAARVSELTREWVKCGASVRVLTAFPNHPTGVIPPAYRGEVLGQKDALDYYRTVTDVSWTYFSPAATIAPGVRTGKFRLGGDRLITDAKGESRISMEDYAVAVLDEAERPAHTRQRFTIGY